jgi:hypothetical protein
MLIMCLFQVTCGVSRRWRDGIHRIIYTYVAIGVYYHELHIYIQLNMSTSEMKEMHKGIYHAHEQQHTTNYVYIWDERNAELS